MDTVTVQGTDIPALGFGTAPMKGATSRSAVAHAIEVGYRHIDTAQMYENEAAVGTAIEHTEVDREDLFLVTKIHRRNLAYEDVLSSVATSLDRLDTWIDLLLIHAPSSQIPVSESIEAMNDLQTEGQVDHIGVSNFSVDQLQSAMEASATPILTNQVKYHPYHRQDALLQFCLENDVCLTAYSPLAKGRVVGDGVLQEIGERYGKTEAQVCLRWLIQQDQVVAIPKAASAEHRTENIDIFDFQLTAEEMDRIFELNGGLLEQLRNRLGL